MKSTKRDKGPTVEAVAPQERKQIETLDSQGLCRADQAAWGIEGEGYARAYIDRLATATAQPGELAVLLAFLRGAMLEGACRVIEQALRGRYA